jgi:hypothetical protein
MEMTFHLSRTLNALNYPVTYFFKLDSGRFAELHWDSFKIENIQSKEIVGPAQNLLSEDNSRNMKITSRISIQLENRTVLATLKST